MKMKTQRIGYIRVSSVDQNEARQLDGVQIDRVFTDKASGKDLNRPALQEAIRYARDGDTLIVHSLDRLARSLEDMFRLVRELNEKGVSVQFMKENMVFSAGKDDPRSMLLFGILGSFAQFERSLIRERQKEGIAIAKAKGVYKGRKPKMTDEQVNKMRDMVLNGVSKSEVARRFNINRDTVYSYLHTASHHNDSAGFSINQSESNSMEGNRARNSF
jgi:DNA invertase Pin-like site-specific DNA recombinase